MPTTLPKCNNPFSVEKLPPIAEPLTSCLFFEARGNPSGVALSCAVSVPPLNGDFPFPLASSPTFFSTVMLYSTA